MGKLLLTLTLVAFSSGVLCNTEQNLTDTANSTLDPMGKSDNTENDAASANGEGLSDPTNLPNGTHLLGDSLDLSSIGFTFYNKEIQNGSVIVINQAVTVPSNFKPEETTFVITHGFKDDEALKSCNTIRDALLKRSSGNVIIVNWTTIFNDLSEETVAERVPEIAAYVATFVKFMQSNSLQIQKLKMVGFSVGAHIVSLAARDLKQSNSPVPEVIALDPASFMFENKDPGGRVDRSDADHVQVIHTNAGKLGMYREVGTSDFYANRGTIQPGCERSNPGQLEAVNICSHERSYQYYSESIGNPHGFPGKSLIGVELTAYMGGVNLQQQVKGYMFNFNTNATKPFALVTPDK